MERIKIPKQDLLDILTNNRKKHKEDYKKAIKAFRANAADLYAKELDKIISGKDFSTHMNINKPISYVKEYDTVIKMLQLTVDDIIELDRTEFLQLVQDEWSWKSSFISTYRSVSSYIGISGVHGSYGSSGTSGYSGGSGTSGWSAEIDFSNDELDEE